MKRLNLKEEYIKYCEKERNSIIAYSALKGTITEENKKLVEIYNHFIEEAKHNRFETSIYYEMLDDVIYQHGNIIYGR